MNKPKTDRLLKGIIGTSFALASLSACYSPQTEDLVNIPQTSPEEPPPSPEETGCEVWTWDAEAEAYQCAEEGSEHHGHYYAGGSWFPTFAAFMAGRALGSAGSSPVTNQRQDSSTSTNTQTNQQSNQNQQTNQQNQSQQNNNQTTNSRSGMGGGGFFGG
ncbi:DUF1190 domain-containing protein [Alkalihalophilus marmarensis]|uniref:DUF1190 domain-containing protein n=1 Tax=Alkalihalophilus marmarensis TaxID=521377 RepID=UPI002DBA59EB|nr:DUF1190 domain-containing protein [Alkalihalophilus marmarensis]MEC2073895.1 DUF1190 domain-containing protein [Alkalihalophilus marmarensis]